MESFDPAIFVAPVTTEGETAVAKRRWDTSDGESYPSGPSISRRVGYKSYYLVTLRLRDGSNDFFEFYKLQELERFAHADENARLFHPLYQRDF
jgi:hypothetical protein